LLSTSAWQMEVSRSGQQTASNDALMKGYW
jgi:hypothetical protein